MAVTRSVNNQWVASGVMAGTRPNNNRWLALDLTEKESFYAGDTIIGSITRSAYIVDPDTTLKLEFRGGAKVTIVERRATGPNNNLHSSVYRQGIDFFLHQPIEQEIYRGPIHIPHQAEEPLTWSFAVTIPKHPDESLRRQINIDALFLGLDDMDAFELPATFTSESCYIEYVLYATLTDSKGEVVQARLPVNLRRRSTLTPISDFRLQAFRDMRARASTYRLDPGTADAGLTFKQKAKELFGSSKVPSLAFSLQVSYPSVVQIGHPEPAPFHVRAVMRQDTTSENLHDTHPALIITKFRLGLWEASHSIASGSFHPHQDTDRHKWTLIDWKGKAPEALSVKRTPSRDPSPGLDRHSEDPNALEGQDHAYAKLAAKAGEISKEPPNYEKEVPGDEAPLPDAETLIIPWESALLPLDLGQALGLRVPTRFKHELRRIHSSFTYLTIKADHQLRWEMEVDVAGESREFEASHNIEVLGPSDDDMLS